MNALALNSRTGLDCYLLTGPDSAATLAGAGLPAPQTMLAAVEQQGAIVARTGRDEFLAILPQALTAPAGGWCFKRADRVLALSGDGWIDVMAQLCQFDFRTLQPGDWLMAQVAGVGCWLYRERETGALLIGFDTGYSHYLENTLRSVVADIDRVGAGTFHSVSSAAGTTDHLQLTGDAS